MGRKKRAGPLPKDIPILCFIWRWKVATTAAITARNFQDHRWSPKTTYWRLSRLKERGFLELLPTGHTHQYVWAMTQRGFKAIESKLPALCERGFGCENVEHDLMVEAAHLGNHLPRHSAQHISDFTEQELRRFDPSCYPEWVPQSKTHRPDGYWYLPKGHKNLVIALEVELSRKVAERYSQIIDFYNCTPTVDTVIWIVASQSLANTIQPCAKLSAFAYRDIHQFILLEDFKKLGWQSTIVIGSKRGQQLSDILDKNTSGTPLVSFQDTSGINWIPTILDTALQSVKSTTCTNPSESKNRLLNASVPLIAVSQTV